MLGQARWDIIKLMAERVKQDIIEQEDRKVTAMIEGMTEGMNQEKDTTCYNGMHKAFDVDGYIETIKGFTKDQLRQTLIREAELRYERQCDLDDVKRQNHMLQGTIRRYKTEMDLWKSIAYRLKLVVQELMDLEKM